MSGTGFYITDHGARYDFTVDAHTAGAYPAATGSFRFEQADIGFWLEVDVTQLNVVDNVASVCGVITDASEPDSNSIGSKDLTFFQDNGSAGTDLFNPGFAGAGWGEGICDLTPASDNWWPLSSGDIVVSYCDAFKDKPGTDKDKCKD